MRTPLITLAALTGLAGLAGPVPAAPTKPTPPAEEASLVVSVSDEVTTAALGDRLSYQISVRNQSRSGAYRLDLRFTPPGGSELGRLDRGGTRARGDAAWRLRVGAGRTVTVSAQVRIAELAEGANGLAAIACVMRGKTPVLCATDVNQIPGREDIHAAATARDRSLFARAKPWLAVGTGGLAAIAVGVVVLLAVGRHLRTRRSRTRV